MLWAGDIKAPSTLGKLIVIEIIIIYLLNIERDTRICRIDVGDHIELAESLVLSSGHQYAVCKECLQLSMHFQVCVHD